MPLGMSLPARATLPTDSQYRMRTENRRNCPQSLGSLNAHSTSNPPSFADKILLFVAFIFLALAVCLVPLGTSLPARGSALTQVQFLPIPKKKNL